MAVLWDLEWYPSPELALFTRHCGREKEAFREVARLEWVRMGDSRAWSCFDRGHHTADTASAFDFWMVHLLLSVRIAWLVMNLAHKDMLPQRVETKQSERALAKCLILFSKCSGHQQTLN